MSGKIDNLESRNKRLEQSLELEKNKRTIVKTIYYSNQTINNSEEAFCINLYDPVCSVNGKTYSNSCFAALDNAIIKYFGEC